jgi:hypothetical protein
MVQIDRAKNSLRAARVIRLNSSAKVFSDSVGASDRDDLYAIQLTNRSTLSLTVDSKPDRKPNSKRAGVAVQLFSLKTPKLRVLRAIGATSFADLARRQTKKYLNLVAAGKSPSSINSTLEAGTYYLRIYGNRGESRYRLSGSLSPAAVPAAIPTAAPSSPLVPTAPFLSQTWIRQFGTAANDYAYGTAVDSTGAVYVAGVTTASNAFSGSGFVSKYNKDGSFVWQRPVSLAGSTAVSDVAVDAAGNYYVAGAEINGLNSDGFLVKYSSAGQELWRQEIASKVSIFDAADAASGIFIDGNDVYLTGVRGGAPAPFSQGKAFVAKYDSNGQLNSTFGNGGIAEFGTAKTTAASGITVVNGTIYISGITDASLELSNNSSANLVGGDAFVASFDRNGNLLWDQTLSSGTSADYARGIAVNGSDVYIVGQTAGTLPSGSLAANTYAGGDADAFIAKYSVANNSGTLQWVKQVGGTGLDSAQAITIDPTGKIYAAGETNTGLFGNALGGSDAWIAQFNSSGSLMSAAQIGTAKDDEAYSITADGAGMLYLAGQTQGTFAAANSQNQGNYDVWLAKYS